MRKYITQFSKTFKKNEIKIIISIVFFCFAVSLMFYVFMGLPRKGTIAGHEISECQSVIDKAEHNGRVTNIVGWFLVRDQESSKQLKKEIVLCSSECKYSYPVEYIDRPDISEIFGNIYGRSGFALQINNIFIKKGTYKLYMKYVYNNKKFVVDLKKEIVLK
jgi:hypothetical protein